MRTPEQFREMMMKGNRRALDHMKKYEANEIAINIQKGDNKGSGRVAAECSDGRGAGGISTVMRDPEALARFNVRYLPVAGCIVTTDLERIVGSGYPALELQKLLKDRVASERMFGELDDIFLEPLREQQTTSLASTLAAKKILLGEDFPGGMRGRVTRQAEWLMEISGAALLNENMYSATFAPGALADKVRNMSPNGNPVTLTFRSHSDKYKMHHGCGAFGSHLDKALNMTAINALAAQAYVDHRFRGHPLKPHIVREHHYTGDAEEIVDALSPELLAKMDPHLREAILQSSLPRLNGRAPFSPLYYKDEKTMLIRHGKGNPFGINREEHAERAIRVEQDGRALVTESVLRQTMLPDQAMMLDKMKRLIGIARANRLARDPLQPLFIHLNRPEGNAHRAHQYDELERALLAERDVQEMKQQGMLFIMRSRTVPYDFEKCDRLQMRFE